MRRFRNHAKQSRALADVSALEEVILKRYKETRTVHVLDDPCRLGRDHSGRMCEYWQPEPSPVEAKAAQRYVDLRQGILDLLFQDQE